MCLESLVWALVARRSRIRVGEGLGSKRVCVCVPRPQTSTPLQGRMESLQKAEKEKPSGLQADGRQEGGVRLGNFSQSQSEGTAAGKPISVPEPAAPLQ